MTKPPVRGDAAKPAAVAVEEAQAAPAPPQLSADQTQISVSRGFGSWLKRAGCRGAGAGLKAEITPGTTEPISTPPVTTTPGWRTTVRS